MAGRISVTFGSPLVIVPVLSNATICTLPVSSIISDFKALPGNGLSGNLDGNYLLGGNLKFIGEHVSIPAEFTLPVSSIETAVLNIIPFFAPIPFPTIIATGRPPFQRKGRPLCILA